jgi:intracellular sulfur oxidation DsrE/DsrF family protein
MSTALSENSTICYREIGNLLAGAAGKFCEHVVTIPFGQTAKALTLSPRSSIFDNMSKMENSGVGHSTNLHEAFKVIDKLDTKVDRVIIFSDLQAYGDDTGSSYWGRSATNGCQEWTNKYRTKVPHLWIHSVDLAGHGTTKVCGNKVNLIAGWSDKVLNFIHAVEEGGADLIKTIEEYQI